MKISAEASVPSLRWLRRAPAGIAAGAAARLGVLSGTFNPPTLCHVRLAERARAQLALGEVLFVLPETPPHKRELEATLEDRAAMLALAVEDEPQFSAAISTHGLFLDIHGALAPHYPAGTEVTFLAGRDAAERILLEWPYENPAQALAEMFSRFAIAVAERGARFALPPDSPAARYAGKILHLEMPAECAAISASLLRQRLRERKGISGLLPEKIEDYIAARGLYRGRS